jgi:WD40 repeat protein
MPPSQLFLCYAREDAAFCDTLAAALRERDIAVRWDRSLSPTLDYAEQIRGMIRSSDAFAIVLSKASVESPECRSELQYAIELGKRLIPILKDSDFDPDSLPETVRKIQWCLCSPGLPFDSGVAQIQDALHTSPELIPMHTRLLNRSQEWETSARDGNLLLRDPALREAEAWLLEVSKTETLPQATALQRDYLHFSRTDSVRRARRFRVVASVVIAVLVAITAVAVYFKGVSDRSTERAVQEADRANHEATLKEQEADRANRNAEESKRFAADSNRNAAEARHNADVANERSRTLLEEQGRLDLLAGRWESASLFLTEAYRAGADTPSLRLMLAAAALPLQGVTAVLHGGDAPVSCAALSADGRRLIAGSTDGVARVWDVRTSRLIASLEHEGPVDEVYLNTNGTRALVVAVPSKVEDDLDQIGLLTYEPYATLWNVSTSRWIEVDHWGLAQEFREKKQPPRVAIHASGGSFVMFGLEDEEFSFADGRKIAARAPKTTPNLGTRGREVCADSGIPAEDLPYHRNANILLSCGSTIVTTGAENHVVIWAAPWRTTPVAMVKTARAMIAFRGASSDLAILSPQGEFSQIPAKARSASASIPTGVEALELSPNGSWLLARRDKSGELVDLDKLARRESDVTLDEYGRVDGHRYSRSGQHLLIWTETRSRNDRTVRIDLHLEPMPGSKGRGDSVITSTFPVVVAAASDVGNAFAAEAPGRTWLWRDRVLLDYRQERSASYIEFSANGRYLASALDDGAILVRDLGATAKGGSDPTVKALHSHSGGATYVDFDRTGRRLASASDDGTAKLWDLEKSALIATCRGHAGTIHSVRFSPDATLLATAGDDQTARVWEVPSCRELLRLNHSSAVLTAIFDARGQRLATVDSASVRVWDLPRETRSPADMAALVSRLAPVCLVEGRLGRWSTPAIGADRGVCLVR